MKITKKELQQIIKEEAIKFKRKIELERELSEVKKQLDEVHAPIGLDIKSETAAEIAISVAAQLIQIKNRELR